ncbi:cell wall-binding repeat-containing protein [Euzebya tangerina]|uniref:cell wall-binding repeat-containing protein n=1 Tax=Euzebya tangerina TaxID=591198 RepID=UPI000E3210CD|nr:cell wall-binding repeat-containing protein [Euzebya tangerina]
MNLTLLHHRVAPLLRALVVAALTLALLALPTVADAAQGFGPTTDLTGFDDAAPAPPLASFHQGCFPAGGAEIPDPEIPEGDAVFVGGGWGHGAGMSQYGAQGAAQLGCTSTQILETYFPGASVASTPGDAGIVIGLSSSVQSTTLTAESEPVAWELCHYETGECEDLPVVQDTRDVWTVQILGDASYRITEGGEVVFEGGDFEQNLRAQLSGSDDDDRRLGVSTTGHTYRWGVLQLDSVQSATSAAFLTLHFEEMERYLLGLAEVPSSWPAAALEAQAISGRSYALSRIATQGLRDSCRCNLLATPQDQNYEGYDYELADARGGGAWRAGVEATSGTMLAYEGQPAETFYSSSHGGFSESARFVFGGEVPYTAPVDDSRWDLASSNPRRRWTSAVSAAELGAAAGVGVATDIELLEPRGAGGRVGHPSRGYGGVQVTGTDGQVVLTGDDVRRAFGLFSTLYDVIDNLSGEAGTPEPDPPGIPDPEIPEPADPNAPGLVRAAGQSRIDTAVQVSRLEWDTAPAVVLSAADRFPDALAGVRLAATLEAPLLLTDSTQLSSAVAAELERLETDTVWLLGGSAALSSQVRSAIEALDIHTRRLSGPDRFATAAAIATAATVTSEEVTVALGSDWPDAVSASSLAALADGPPTLLVQPDSVPEATVRAIRDLQAERASIVGGSAVISAAVEAELRVLGLEVTRLAGPDRFATAAAVAGAALERRAAEEVPVIVAAGSGFPDALAAGALAGRMGGVLVLAPAVQLSDGAATGSFIEANADVLSGGVVVGGTGVISREVEQALEDRIGD